MALPRPRDRKSRPEGTCDGVGRHGEGIREEEDEEDLARQLRLDAVARLETVDVVNGFGETLEPLGASWDRGVYQDEEALPLPVPQRRRQPCVRALHG